MARLEIFRRVVCPGGRCCNIALWNSIAESRYICSFQTILSLQSVVQPVLRDIPGRWLTLNGLVNTPFGDQAYLERKYRSSLVSNPNAITDRSYMSDVYSARCSDSWNSYLSAWEGVKNHTTIQSQRLAPWTIDRSTQGQINGSWVQNQNSTNASNRALNNVTLAIPYPGVLKAARHASNSIAQPDVRIQ